MAFHGTENARHRKKQRWALTLPTRLRLGSQAGNLETSGPHLEGRVDYFQDAFIFGLDG